jgi:Ca2+-binding RTX toxin-like protein
VTVYVIDPINPRPPTFGDNEDALCLDEGEMLVLAVGAEIAAHGKDSWGVWASFKNTLLIEGRIFSAQATAVGAESAHISIRATGWIWGRENGIQLLTQRDGGTTGFLENAGTILSDGCGVYANGVMQASIRNSGTIRGSIGIEAIVFSNDRITVTNQGLIAGSQAAIYSPGNATFIENRGTIQGNVILSNHEDLYDGRGGSVSGIIDLHTGNDTALGGNSSETIQTWWGTKFIDGGAGVDTLAYRQAATVDLRITGQQQTSQGSWDTIRSIENLNGSEFSDRFFGNNAANTFTGNDGNDNLDGYNGDDLLIGGRGDDLLVGGSGSDTAVFTGMFSDYSLTGGTEGATAIADKRASGDGTDILYGVEFALFRDRIFTLSPLPSTPVSPPANPTTSATPAVSPEVLAIKNLTFEGGSRADSFIGGKGHDLLNGGLGNDNLVGDQGQDTFAFSSKLGSRNVDRIIDFQHSDDTIKLSKAIFSKLQKGLLSESAFWIGAKAHDKSDRIIYNEKTGALSYDADGSGTKYAAIKFAQLKAKTLLKADDFFIG